MSFAAFKMTHYPTGVGNCASGYITHSLSDSTPQIPVIGPVPNIVVTAGNILEVYVVRVEAEPRNPKRGGVMDGISGVSLELVCNYKLHGNVESIAVLPNSSEGRDSIILTFRDAKIAVLEFDDSIHSLRLTSMHCFEGPNWIHLKRGRESFPRGSLVKVDPQGRCGGVLIYGLQIVILKVGDDDDDDDDVFNSRVKSSSIINLRDLKMKQIKDFCFLHGYIEPVLAILEEQEDHTCKISALSIDKVVIWSSSSAVNLPYDAYKLLSVPSPIGGVVVLSANTIHYHNQSSSCALPASDFNLELDAAHGTWISNNVALLSTKTGELLLLTLIYDGRSVQRLDLSKSKASVLASDITTVGNSLFFLGSRLGDSLLVQFSKDEEGEDHHQAKRLRISSDEEEISLYGSTTNNSVSAKKSFSFAVRDSLFNVGPVKDFGYGFNNELVCCSGHGKNGSLCVLQHSIRPETITEVELAGCKGIWTVYHNSHDNVDEDEDEYHAYLIISLEARTLILETADILTEVTESVDYYVQGKTIFAGNLFGRRRVIQVFEHGARILDGSFMNQELSFGSPNESLTVSSVSIADPYVLLKMTDDSLRLLVGDPETCTVTITTPSILEDKVSACSLYHDKGPEPWLRKARTDDQGDIYCVLCYESGLLEIFDVPGFNSVYSVDNFSSGRSHLSPTHDDTCSTRNEEDTNKKPKVVELAMERWYGHHTRPFLFAILSDGTILCYHAYLFENPAASNSSKLKNLRFLRIPLDTSTREETVTQRITMFKNINGHQGFFLSGSRPGWCMLFRERLRFHSQLCDDGSSSVVAFTVLHNVNCNHGFVYVTSQGSLKICQLPKTSIYDNQWPMEKVPLKATPHQVTYYKEKNLYSVIVSYPVTKPKNQSSGEFEVRILEPGGHWETKATIPMQSSEHALTVRVVTLGKNETFLAVGTAYVQGEDVAARGRVILYTIGNLVTEVYSKEVKGAISAIATIKGHLLISSGSKLILHKWNGEELNDVAFFDVPMLYIVSMNVVKNFILLGDVHKSICFLNWNEQESKFSLLAKDYESLDCFASEFLIDGNTLSFVVSDEQKNVKVLYYAPKSSGEKLVSRVEFHVGAHVSKFQMVGPDKINRFGLLFGTLDGGFGCIASIDEVAYRRLHSLQRKLVDSVPHVAGLNPRGFRQFRSSWKARRFGCGDCIIDCELLCHYEMMPLEEQFQLARQIGTTRSQILSNLFDLSVRTSFL